MNTAKPLSSLTVTYPQSKGRFLPSGREARRVGPMRLTNMTENATFATSYAEVRFLNGRKNT